MLASRIVQSFFCDQAEPPAQSELPAQRDELQKEGLWTLALERILAARSSLEPSLRAELNVAVAWELQCKAALVEISKATSHLQTRILVFKGCSLALATYPRRGQRSFGDIDMALASEHRQEFNRILTENLGFTTSHLECAHLSRGEVSLDLHHHPLNQLKAVLKPDDDWFQAAVPLHVQMPNFYRLSTRHEFVLSLFHGAKHAFNRASWLVDSLLLANLGDITELAETVEKYNAHTHLWLASECLQQWFQLEFPRELGKLARPPKKFDLFSQTLARKILNRQAPESLGMLTPVWAIRSWLVKSHYLKEALFPGRQPWRQRLEHLSELFRQAYRGLRNQA